MKKFLLSLATVLCMGSFASADEVTVSIAASNFTGDGTTATYSDNGFTFTLNKAKSTTANRLSDSDHLRIYQSATFSVKGDDNQQITQMVVTATAASYSETLSADTGSGSWSGATYTWEGDANEILLTASKQCRINKIVISYVSAGAVVVETPTFSIAGGTYDKAQTVELSAAEGCTIYYTTDGQNPTDDVDDGSTIKYTAPITVDKSMTIKAIAFDANDNKSNIVSETYTIVETLEGAEGDGTEADPYNAVAAYNAALLGSTAEVYVKGTVVSITEISTQYGNATYYISADGTATNQFYIYRGYNLGGEKFTSEDQLHVGDKVVVNGKLSTYNGTPQLASGNKIVTLNGEEPEPIVLEGEGTVENPFTVADVIAINPTDSNANTEYPDSYWVSGYIVGYSSSSSSALTPVFSADDADSATNIILGPTADCTDIELCVPVQLPTGRIRAALNLQDHPTNLHQEVAICGNIYKYFGVPGIKNPTDYKLASDGVAAVVIDENAPVEYFNLQGVRVENPANGLYIMRQGDKVVKVIK